MRQRAEPATASGGAAFACSASWSRRTPCPSPLGLVVAIIVGGTAAISWGLSAWIFFVDANLPEKRQAGAGVAEIDRPVPDTMPESTSATATTSD